MGIDYYFRREDNRSRYLVGKVYALKRMIGHGVVDVSDRESTSLLAAQIELALDEDGIVLSDLRREDGYSSYCAALAADISRWSGGQWLSLVDEQGFDDWQRDPAWDEESSTTEFRAS